MKVCTKCKVEKKLEDFGKGNDPLGLMYMCRKCNSKKSKEWSENNYERMRDTQKRYNRLNAERIAELAKANYIKRAYKMTVEEYTDFISSGCEVCGVLEDLQVDHDHRCCPGQFTCGNCVRGVLCARHNKVEGMLTSIEEAERMLNYKVKHFG